MFRKDVDFVAKDDEEQIATGIVMVPDKVDLQNDFAREDTIQEFADQFADFMEVGQADGGVMHAVWPTEHISLDDQRILDEATDIGGKTAPAGAWVQEWHFADEDLWQLVDDDILSGYSIGGVDVHWDGPFEQDELEDVDTSEVPDDEFVWEIVRGIIREVSAVDIPAVPDAQILETKSAYEKRLADHLGNRDGFIEEAQQRGHSEAEAERLWEYLNRAVDIEGAGEPGEKGWFSRAREFFSPGGPGANDRPDLVAQKEGQTLSRANRQSLFAAIDAGLDVLEDAGVDHGMTRFTDREDIAFDLSEHTAREWPDAGDDGDEGGDADNPLDLDADTDSESDSERTEIENHAPEGDTSDPDGGGKNADDMTNENETPGETETETGKDAEPESEEKSLAEQNAEQISKLTESVEQLTDTVTEEQTEEKTAEIEIDGEVFEVTESEAKSWFDDNEGGAAKSDAFDDAPPHIQALAERVEGVESRLEAANRQSGFSDQLGGGKAGTGGRDSDDDNSEKGALDGLAAALN